MSGWVSLGLTSYKQRIKCLAKGHNAVLPVRLKLVVKIKLLQVVVFPSPLMRVMDGMIWCTQALMFLSAVRQDHYVVSLGIS